MKARSLFAVGVCALFFACSGSSGPDKVVKYVPSPLGQACRSDADCTGGFVCAEGSPAEMVCTQACTADADCTAASGGVCTTDMHGRSVCVESCTGNGTDGVGQGWTCVHGRPVACALAGPPSCGCGCPSGQYCSAGVGCVDLGGTGAGCSDSSQCKAGYCDTWSGPGACAAPLGGACVQGACSYCLQPGNNAGPSLCSHQCLVASDCSDGWLCLGGAGYACYPPCSLGTGCPAGFKCTPASDGTLYCEPHP
jgi:hypothetical protein